MKYEGRRRARTGPNLTPLIDVVFLLLVFFMLTAHFVDDEAIAVALPTADTGAAVDESEVPVVTVSADGLFRIGDVVMNERELEESLTRSLANQDEKQVRIKGDRDVQLKVAVSALDVARRAGATGVEIVTHTAEEDDRS